MHEGSRAPHPPQRWVGGCVPSCPLPPHCVQSLLSIRQDDKVVCPRTKEVFHFSQAEKVYIM